MPEINITHKAKKKLEKSMIEYTKKRIKKDHYKKKEYFISYSSFVLKLLKKYNLSPK